ncbi:MAG: hypothetical protein AB8F65_06295 [Woeseiaceae bacterium]
MMKTLMSVMCVAVLLVSAGSHAYSFLPKHLLSSLMDSDVIAIVRIERASAVPEKESSGDSGMLDSIEVNSYIASVVPVGDFDTKAVKSFSFCTSARLKLKSSYLVGMNELTQEESKTFRTQDFTCSWSSGFVYSKAFELLQDQFAPGETWVDVSSPAWIVPENMSMKPIRILKNGDEAGRAVPLEDLVRAVRRLQEKDENGG